MCISVYLGSDQPLHALTWEIPVRRISLSELTREGPELIGVFSKPYIYCIGTRSTGDGCGFQGDSDDSRRTREALASFLERALERVADLELFAAFHGFGTSGFRPERFNSIGPSDIRTWMPGFDENAFYLVLREA